MFRISQGFGIGFLLCFSVWMLPAAPLEAQVANASDEQLRQVLIQMVKQLLAERDRPLPSLVNLERVPLDDVDVSAVYAVTDGNLTPTPSVSRDAEYWQVIRTIIPSRYWSDVGEFVVYNEPNSDTDAFVQGLYFGDNEIWRIAINEGTVDRPSEEEELYEELIIHEFAHILTLDEDQIDGDVSRANCPGHYIDEGCPEDDSYVQLFIDEFWSTSDLNFVAVAAEDRDAEELLFEFYEDNEDEFVSDYAATNPLEDLAETFLAFVIYEKPAGDAILEEKIQFLYQFPELVEVQEEILESLGY